MIISRAAAAAGLAFTLTALPLAVHGQLQKAARIGVLSGDAPNDSPCVQRLRQGLGELGYVEGKTHVLELRWAEGRSDVFPGLAADLVRMNVDLIVSAADPAALAVKDATSSIPIVLASSFYPVELGVIASLAHPGGNVTGVTHFTPELMAKRVQLLKELLPKATHFVVLRLPGGMQDFVVRDMEGAARQLGVQLYGPNVLDGCARAARYVDRILKGAKPADLPVEQPTRIDFVVNLKTAKTLGISIPPSLLQRADRVVQ